MARGAALAQFDSEEPRDVPLNLRVTQSFSDALSDALTEEKKSPKNRALTRATLGALLVELGLDVYWVRHDAGAERVREVAGSFGGDQRKAMAELIRRGLESWEAEQGKKPKR